MKDQFKRILELVRKTGDTMVVTDTNGQDVYVVMDLDQYEAILDGMSEHFGDWEEGMEDEERMHEEEKQEWEIPDGFVIDDPEGGLADEPFVSNEPPDVDIWSTMQSANNKGPTWDMSKMNTDEIEDLEKQYRAFAEKNVQQVVVENKPKTHVTPQRTPSDDFSEEQFYLEPIE